MNIITADEKYNYYIWQVLNKIKEELLPNKNTGDIIDYRVDRNIALQGIQNPLMQDKILQFLKKENVIEEIDEHDVEETGEGVSPYRVFENHHLKILNRFDEFYKKYQNLVKNSTDTTKQSFDILSIIPKGGRYIVHRRMAKLFRQKSSVQNYRLAQCIKPTINDQRNKKRKFKKTDYDNKKDSYNSQIKNYFRTLRKFLNPAGYSVKFHTQLSEIVST